MKLRVDDDVEKLIRDRIKDRSDCFEAVAEWSHGTLLDLLHDRAELVREVERLREVALSLCDRMDRARGIIRTPKAGRDIGNWGLLDATLDRERLEDA